MADDRSRLEEHLASVGWSGTITEWKILAGGRSATSVKVSLDGPDGPLEAVLHLEPEEGPLSGLISVRRQFALLRALEATPVRAPEPLWFVPEEVLGRPGYLSRFTDGDVPDPFSTKGRAYMAEHPAGGPLADDFVRCMVEIHAVPVADLPAELMDRPDAAIPHAQREHERWSAVLARSKVFASDPLLAYTDAWLLARRPAAGPLGLVHGDYRFGNVVVEGDRIASALDWELSEIGDTVFDLAQACSPALRVNGLASALWEEDALVARYEELSGTPVDRDAFAFFRVLSTFKVACLWANSSLTFDEGADDLVAARAGYSVLESRPMVAESVGLAVPDGGRAPDDRVLATVRAALREASAEAPSGTRAVLGLASAVLRGRARPPAAARDGFADDVDALARDAGADGIDGDDGVARLAALARAVLADPAVAADEQHPLHHRLRGLVAESIPLVSWP